MSSLTLLTTDWAQWDDAYQFMQSKSPAFIKSNMPFTTFANAKLNLIMFFDTNGKLFYGLNYDLEKKKFIPIPADLLQRLISEKTFTTVQNDQNNKIGILKTPEGYVVLSTMPILTSEGAGPARGVITMGYFFSETQIQKLSEIVDIQVSFFPLPLQNPNADLANAYNQLIKGNEYYIFAVNRYLAYGYAFIKDINQQPIGMIRISSERDFYNQGVKTIDGYLLIVIGIGILMLAFIWYLLKILILDRIISVSNQVIDINSESNFSKRITLKGRDEMNQMVAAVNSLMEMIELIQEQLKYRLSLRTEELDKISRLNKNLNSEIGHQRETESKLREGEKMLRHLAYYDVVTNVPNRIYFTELLQNLINQSLRNDEHFVVLFVDIDKFKQINDTYGHNIGDKLLKHAAEQLKRSVRDNDIVARLAGDEFILILKHLYKKALITPIVEHMLLCLSEPITIDQFQISSTYSIGISIFPDDGETIETLQKHADLAMYYAKKKNGNTYCYYDESQRTFVK